MKYEGDIIRPPSEPHTLVLHVTVGGTHNRCTFCPSFKDKRSASRASTKSWRISSTPPFVSDGWTGLFLCDGEPSSSRRSA